VPVLEELVLVVLVEDVPVLARVPLVLLHPELRRRRSGKGGEGAVSLGKRNDESVDASRKMRRGRRRPGAESRDAPGTPGPCRRRTGSSPPTSSRSRAPLATRRARKSARRRSAEPAERCARRENETRFFRVK
jgi:hypothetical protein